MGIYELAYSLITLEGTKFIHNCPSNVAKRQVKGGYDRSLRRSALSECFSDLYANGLVRRFVYAYKWPI